MKDTLLYYKIVLYDIINELNEKKETNVWNFKLHKNNKIKNYSLKGMPHLNNHKVKL